MRSSRRRIFHKKRYWIAYAVVVVLLGAAIAAGLWAADFVYGGGQPAQTHGNSTVVGDEEGMQPAAIATDSTQGKGFGGSLEAGSAVLVDGDGAVLFELEADGQRYPASMTKVLTAVLALEYGNLDDVICVGDEANMPKPGSSSAGLRYGETLSLFSLLNAMMIPSGNDAAYVIATYVGRKAATSPEMGYEEAVAAFVELMNSRAAELGAIHSHFMNPDGYHDEQHYTTARDMALIAGHAMGNREFRRIVIQTQYELPAKGADSGGDVQTQARSYENTNRLLDSFGPYFLKSCTGIKTGHTEEAGYCLVSSASSDGKSLICVVMGSTEEGVWQDSAALLQWGLKAER